MDFFYHFASSPAGALILMLSISGAIASCVGILMIRQKNRKKHR